MRVLLISANTEKINMVTLPLGLGCVAEATRQAGHEVKLLDLMAQGDIRSIIEESVASFEPEVIGVSVRNVDDQAMGGSVFLLDRVREVLTICRGVSPAPLVLGGAGYSMFPEAALAHLGADMGIQGEGEAAFTALVARLEAGEDPAGLPGLHLPGERGGRRGMTDRRLDDFPLPAPALWIGPGMAENPDIWVPVQSRRGCPMDCSYCSTAHIEGRSLRKRSPERVVRWLKELVRSGASRFFFVDNTFNLPPSYAGALCREMIAGDLGISWRCILYPANVRRDLVRDMAEAGCTEVSLGFESGADQILQSMNKRFDTNAVREISRMLADHGIRQMGFLLLGGPGETRASAMESLEFADSLPLDMVRLTVGVRIYPHTPLATLSRAEGVVGPEDSLLLPRFYLARDVADWLPETADAWLAKRPNWIK